jgi:Tol biopolymer transport system component
VVLRIVRYRYPAQAPSPIERAQRALARQFVWFDRSGKEISRVGDSVSTGLSEPSLSRDGQRVVLYRSVNGNTDIWILDTRRGALSRFTSDAADDVMPVWSPDGGRIVFSSNRTGIHDLYWKSVTGDRSEELLLSTAQAKLATDWGPRCAAGNLVSFGHAVRHKVQPEVY